MSDKDKTFRTLLYNLLGTNNGSLDQSHLKDLIGAVANWAGKGKDELVQIICREIGIATAAMFKEPISQILENRKLQITFELVMKDEEATSTQARKKKKKASVKKKPKKSKN